MKKGCLIVLIVIACLLLALLVAGYVGYRVLDGKFGLTLAPAISHETLCTPDTRIRLLINPESLTEYAASLVPADADLPTGPFELKDVLVQIMPREIAVLARTDMNARKMHLSFFVNEKRGGVLLRMIANESDLFDQVNQIEWTSEGVELRQRGALVAEGNLAIPEAVEKEMNERWSQPVQEAGASVQGRHHASLVIDNRAGDLLAFAGAAIQAAGEDWDSIRKEQMAEMAMGVVEAIQVARLDANLINLDSATIDLHIDADPKSGPGLQFLLSGVAIPQLRDFLQEEYNLVLSGENRWHEDKSAIIGTYTLTGFEALLRANMESSTVDAEASAS